MSLAVKMGLLLKSNGEEFITTNKGSLKLNFNQLFLLIINNI